MQHGLQSLGDYAATRPIRVHEQASASQLARDDLGQRLHQQLEINKPGYMEAKDVSVCTKLQWRPLCYTFETVVSTAAKLETLCMFLVLFEEKLHHQRSYVHGFDDFDVCGVRCPDLASRSFR